MLSNRFLSCRQNACPYITLCPLIGSLNDIPLGIPCPNEQAVFDSLVEKYSIHFGKGSYPQELALLDVRLNRCTMFFTTKMAVSPIPWDLLENANRYRYEISGRKIQLLQIAELEKNALAPK
jgi:hypothetical protein